MRFKEGVRVHGVKPEIIPAMMVMDSLYQGYIDYPHGVVITSIADGQHSDNSKHYGGNAFDCRIWHLSVAEVTRIAGEARQMLGDDYYVRVEKDHIHVDWRPMRLR